MLRLVFMGSPDFAVPTLAALIEAGHTITAVYSQPPRPGGRGKVERPTPVHKLALDQGLMVRTPTTLKDAGESESLAELAPDVVVVVAYGLLLPPVVLAVPRLSCLNLHASLLPRWRGAAPIQRAIMAGDQETGVAVMQMEAGLDTGPVLLSEHLAIAPTTNAGDLHDALADLGAPLMLRALEGLEAGSLTPWAQPAEGITYATKIEKSECRLDWQRPAIELDRQVRGLAPFPGAWFGYAGERIKVLATKPLSGASHEGEPGKVLAADDLVIGCGAGALRLITVQRGGRRPLSAAELRRGFPLPPGADLGLVPTSAKGRHI